MLKVLDDACKPTKGSKYSAGIDLYAREDITIGAGETKLVPLGVKIDIDKFFNSNFGDNSYVEWHTDRSNFMESHHLELFNRSSTAYKKGLFLANGTGIIDLDFEDEICALMYNPISPSLLSGMASIWGANGEKSEYQNQTNLVVNTNELLKGLTNRIKKGDKICQIILKENKTYLMGIESEDLRTGGFGSSGS